MPRTSVGRGQPLVLASKAFAVQWILLNRFDCLLMLIVAGLSAGIHHMPVPVTRTFPITFNGSGDIIYPQWAYPYRGWIIPSWLSGLVSIGSPIAVYVVAQVRIKSAWDASNAVMGSTWAVLLASLFHVVLKQLTGGFRPYFLDVCMPDVSRGGAHNETGLNGVGFQQVMYTTEVCTQTDAVKLKTAITSFPSGHSSAAFAGFGFLFLWMNAKLKVWADHKPAFWKLALVMLPLLLAVTIACSLTVDAAHNWYDIVGGSVLGAAMAVASYRTSYAAVWDWRFNHLPLQQREAFLYGAEGDADYATQTITRSVGWGKKREWLPERVDGASSSASFARGDVVFPDERGRGSGDGGQRGSQRRVRAEDEVA
ncbi:1,3-beta-glucanosyltransferase [Tolypocladium capitatum]|uniref:1,3-beta-glucanosyltransferase n=1 Tax=Tolypocladium capitatum TaxID=45235 RepID=A0A2K3QIQ4_9HYPO|nr:1,3-beta-glucanosyltransferase [Tolypocladium capitatum]